MSWSRLRHPGEAHAFTAALAAGQIGRTIAQCILAVAAAGAVRWERQPRLHGRPRTEVPYPGRFVRIGAAPHARPLVARCGAPDPEVVGAAPAEPRSASRPPSGRDVELVAEALALATVASVFAGASANAGSKY